MESAPERNGKRGGEYATVRLLGGRVGDAMKNMRKKNGGMLKRVGGAHERRISRGKRIANGLYGPRPAPGLVTAGDNGRKGKKQEKSKGRAGFDQVAPGGKEKQAIEEMD